MIELFSTAGFDLVHPFDARAVASELGLPMLVDDERPCGWLVGNTRALWPKLVAARAADAELAASEDPIECYLEQTCARVPDVRCVFAHRRYDGAFVPFQRLAVAAGFGTLAASQLVIHPVYGPWFALRAVVLARGTPITRVLPVAACDCADRCGAAFARARAADATWRHWLAVRDACCVGIEYRYEDDQIAYHYTKSRRLLE
jgi:methylmalonic aciduria homocystinuria type C protein